MVLFYDMILTREDWFEISHDERNDARDSGSQPDQP
jgi:hypothetical protein